MKVDTSKNVRACAAHMLAQMLRWMRSKWIWISLFIRRYESFGLGSWVSSLEF